MKLFLSLIICLSFGATAAAQDSSHTAGQEAEPQAEVSTKAVNTADKGKKICKYEQRTGSRFQKRLCRTEEEWEAIAEAAKSGLDEMRRQPQGMPDGST